MGSKENTGNKKIDKNELARCMFMGEHVLKK